MVSDIDTELILDRDCPVRQVISIVGDKWTCPVLYVLTQGTKRYSEIQYIKTQNLSCRPSQDRV